MSETQSTESVTAFAQQWFTNVSTFFVRPVKLFRHYDWRTEFRSDMVASITVAIVLLPQAIAYALIAELPPETGLFAAIVAALIGGLWGSSFHLHTGPTNTTSLIVLSGLLAVSTPGTPEYLLAAGVMAVWAGVLRVVMGVARLGILVNFVSDAVVVGFTAGAGVLIVVNQLRHIFRVEGVSSPAFYTTAANVFEQLPNAHPTSLLIGLGVIIGLLLLRRFAPRMPAPLLVMLAATLAVWFGRLDQAGVLVLGELPRGFPPLVNVPIFDLALIREMGPGIVAVALIGLIEAASISRAVASRSGQYLNSDQEFVGQGLANVAAGFFSGYPVAGSLTRSAVNYEAGAKTQMAAVFSAAWVLLAMILLAPAAAFLPRAALAGILVVTGSGMINHREMRRIWRTAKGDAAVMVFTLAATLLLPLEFAVLAGVLVSFARYIMNTATPSVVSLLPDDEFAHFERRPEKPECPQLSVMSVKGSLYFGAAPHVEDAIREHMDAHPDQKFLLLRMRRVNHCDISGIHMLETVVRLYRQRGGDVFLVGVADSVRKRMALSGFVSFVGEGNFLKPETAITHIFNRILNPAVCMYTCRVRAFKECQALPKSREPQPRLGDMPVPLTADVNKLAPEDFWFRLNNEGAVENMKVIDIREQSEYDRGHLRRAELIPLPDLVAIDGLRDLPRDQDVILVCRSGRRSHQAAYLYQQAGYENVYVLEGGMMALEIAALPKGGQ